MNSDNVWCWVNGTRAVISTIPPTNLVDRTFDFVLKNCTLITSPEYTNTEPRQTDRGSVISVVFPDRTFSGIVDLVGTDWVVVNEKQTVTLNDAIAWKFLSTPPVKPPVPKIAVNGTIQGFILS